MVENATIIYSDDTDIEKYAKRVKIPVMRICDLDVPLPTVEIGTIGQIVGSQGVLNLATSESKAETVAQPEVKSHAAEARRIEEDNKLQADPAHPAAVQGSDEGRAQGEATGEGSKGKAEERG